MATNLMDTIQQKLANPQPVQGSLPQMGQGQDIATLIKARSGKAQQAGAAPAMSNVAEQVAANQVRTAQAQVGAEGKIQAAQQQEQAADISQREQQSEKQFQEQRIDQKQQLRQKTDAILNEYMLGNKKIRNMQDIENLEQVGFGIRLNNEQYINQLQNEGNRARLDDMSQFRYQAAQDAWGFKNDQAMDQRAFDSMMGLSDREFAERLAEYDAQDIISELEYQSKTASARGKAESAGGIMNGLLGLAGSIFGKDGD